MSLREYPKISGKVVCDKGHQIHFELLVSSFCSSWGGEWTRRLELLRSLEVCY
jgi:hypothetical protein